MQGRDLPISIVIATMCASERRDALLRSLRSIRNQAGVDAEVLLIVNGKRFDAGLFGELKSRPDLRVEYQEEGNLPKAYRCGRSLVSREYFAFLDDDDEFLPDSLAPILEVMEKEPSVDVVVSNGVRALLDKETPLFPDFYTFHKDPIKSLFAQNWLSSSSGVYRSRTIGMEFFQDIPKYYEWTSLAFKLAAMRKIHFRNEPFNRIHDTPGSLSKSADFQFALEPFLAQVSSLPLRPELRAMLRRKRADAYHTIADLHLEKNRTGMAWSYHIKSLNGLYGFRFLPFTRKLLAPLFTKTAEAATTQG